MKYSNLRTLSAYEVQYTVLYTVQSMYTKAQSVHINTGGRDYPHKAWGKALEGTVTGIPANAFTININSLIR